MKLSMSDQLFKLSTQDKSENTCPQCGKGCDAIALSRTRGKIFVCNACTIKVPECEEDRALLWFWESDRLWETMDQPENLEKPKLVKVILAIPPENIDFHPGFLPPSQK